MHQSIWKDGKPLFAGNGYADRRKWRCSTLAAIKHAKSLNAFTNASTNSYKRLIPGYEAPVLLAYSSRNRSASCRIPHVNSPAGKCRVRFPDATANPYLAFGMLMPASRHPEQDPSGDAMDRTCTIAGRGTGPDPDRLRSLREALDSLDADRAYLTQGNVFTDEQIDAYIELKMEEVIALEHPASGRVPVTTRSKFQTAAPAIQPDRPRLQTPGRTSGVFWWGFWLDARRLLSPLPMSLRIS